MASHSLSRPVVSIPAHISPIWEGVYGLRHSIILSLLSSNSSIHYFSPKAANCCIREKQTLPTLWHANCVEWRVTAAPLCLWPQCSLTPLPLCSEITMVTLLMRGAVAVARRLACYKGVTFSAQWHTFLQRLAVGQLMSAKKKNLTNVVFFLLLLFLLSGCCCTGCTQPILASDAGLFWVGSCKWHFYKALRWSLCQ